jgi:hypothetical protein
MAGLQDILSDPNYVNANAATKAAIFDKFAPLDSNYANANPETQGAIRSKFGLSAPAAAPVEETRANVGAEVPAWAKEYPKLYSAAVKARQVAGPSVEMLGGMVGGAVGAGAGTLASPTLVINPITGGVAGSALGYGIAKEGLQAADVALGLRPPQTVLQRVPAAAANVAEGATYDIAGRTIIGPAINKLMSLGATGLGKIADINELPKQLAARVARESFETPANVQAARNALQQSVQAGQNLTAQQALAQGKVVAPGTQAVLEKVQAKVAPSVKAKKLLQDEAARMSTIKDITPDMDAAITARRVASKPLYEAADTVIVPIDADISSILSRMPDGTLAKAAEIAKMENRPFIMGKAGAGTPIATGDVDMFGKPIMITQGAKAGNMTGETMHYIKRALGDVAYGPTATTGIGQDAQRAARTLLDDYVKVFETKVPEYGQARQIFSDLSAPVNQAQVLKEMVSVLKKEGGGERIGPFLNTLGRGEEAMLKRAGGRGGPRFEALDEVLTPDQLKTVFNVAKQLETEAAVGLQISQGQQNATDLLKKHLANFRLPQVFNIIATTANKFLDTIGVKIGQKTLVELTKAGETAKSFDELLATLPTQERNKVLKAIGDPNTWKNIVEKTVPKQFQFDSGKALMGIEGIVNTPKATVTLGEPSIVNSLAPQQQNQNALAR